MKDTMRWREKYTYNSHKFRCLFDHLGQKVVASVTIKLSSTSHIRATPSSKIWYNVSYLTIPLEDRARRLEKMNTHLDMYYTI